jgi:hypothetical protein
MTFEYDSDNETTSSEYQPASSLEEFLSGTSSTNKKLKTTRKPANKTTKDTKATKATKTTKATKAIKDTKTTKANTKTNANNLILSIYDSDTDSSKSSNTSSKAKIPKIINTSKNTNTNTNIDREITSDFQGFTPIWDKITNKSKEDYLKNNGHQSVSNNYANLMNFVLSCGPHFSSVINNKSKVLISSVASKDAIFLAETYLFVLVKDHNQGKILYQFSKNGKSSIQMYLLDNLAKVLYKDSLNLSKDIIYKIQIYSQNRDIVIKFDNSHERNQWIQLLS